MTGGRSRAASSATGLVFDEVKHMNGGSQPQVIGLNLPKMLECSSRVECPRWGAVLSMGVIPFEALRRERTSPTTPPSTMPETEL